MSNKEFRSTQVNLEAARDYLTEVYKDTNGKIKPFVLDKSKPNNDNVIDTYAVKEVASINFNELGKYNGQGFDIYHGVNTRSCDRNKKDDVYEVVELYVDEDAKHFAGGKKEALAHIRKIEQQYGIVPTYITDTGHGYHLHFLMKKPIIISNSDDISDIEDLSKDLNKLFKGDNQIHVSALSRIPGFYNNKDRNQPELVEIIHKDLSKKYTLQEIKNLLPVSTRKTSSKPRKNGISTHFNNIPKELPNKFINLLNEDPSLQARWNGNTDGLSDKSGSGIDLSIANILARKNFTPEEIVAVLRNAPYDKQTERTDPYIERTIDKAFEAVSDDSSIASLDKYKNAIPFPLEVFPSEVQDALKEIAKSVSCPVDFVGVPFLTLAGTAIGRTRELVISSSWAESPIIFSATVGVSGSGKTPALNLISSYFRKRQHELANEYKESYKQYKLHFDIYEKQHREWLKDDTNRELSTVPEEPVKPLCPQLFTRDLTYESLIDVLVSNLRGITELTDELTAFFNSLNQYKGKGNDRQRWLELWNGENQITYNRKGKEPIILSNPFVSIFGNIVPCKLTTIKDKSGEDGMLPRFLFAFPDRMDLVYNKNGVAKKYIQMIEDIYQKLFELEPEGVTLEYMKPFEINFTSDAQELWHQHMESQIQEFNSINESNDTLLSAWRKFEAYTARLALIMQGIRYACGEVKEFDSVDKASLDAAIRLVTYFKSQIYKVFNTIQSDNKHSGLKYAIEKIRGKANHNNLPYTVRDAVTNKLCGVRNSKEAQDLFDQLEDAGYGKLKQVGRSGVFTLYQEH